MLWSRHVKPSPAIGEKSERSEIRDIKVCTSLQFLVQFTVCGLSRSLRLATAISDVARACRSKKNIVCFSLWTLSLVPALSSDGVDEHIPFDSPISNKHHNEEADLTKLCMEFSSPSISLRPSKIFICRCAQEVIAVANLGDSKNYTNIWLYRWGAREIPTLTQKIPSRLLSAKVEEPRDVAKVERWN